MSETSTLIGYGGRTIGREELALVPTPLLDTKDIEQRQPSRGRGRLQRTRERGIPTKASA
jgi:hypothetical protein